MLGRQREEGVQLPLSSPTFPAAPLLAGVCQKGKTALQPSDLPSTLSPATCLLCDLGQALLLSEFIFCGDMERPPASQSWGC